jgi:hypothetical protein
MQHVPKEVLGIEDGPGSARHPHGGNRGPSPRVRAEHQQGKVEATDITNEMLIVGAERRDPMPAGGREVVVERHREGGRPNSDDRRGHGEQQHDDALRAKTHAVETINRRRM